MLDTTPPARHLRAMRFSRRTPPDLSPSALSRALAGLGDLIDLTESNPTRCGLDLPGGALARALAVPEPWLYEPDPLGLAAAREAVARYAGSSDRPVRPDRVVLTASTSEAYTFLFKLLCDPGTAVAAPAPSYPLVDVLAELESVSVLRYRLEYEGRWRLDLDSVAAALDAGARAVLVVQPNNPTGSCLSAAEAHALLGLCARRDVPVISDEVFAPYAGFDSGLRAPSPEEGPLLFVLDGLSKAAALPQLKVGWMIVHGPRRLVDAALERLTWIADAFLSVAAPAQRALPRLLALAPGAQRRIRERVTRNRAALVEALAAVPAVDLLASDGGWYSVLRVPRVAGEEQLVLEIAEKARVLIHPGYFYDFAVEAYLVTGLLVPPRRFDAAVARLAAFFSRRFG